MPAYLEPYRKAVARLGAGFEALLWADRPSQAARFETIAAMTELQGRRVLDLGCGRGDLPLFLRERGIRPHAYVGVDALPEMVRESARACAPLGWCRFVHADFAGDEALLPSLAGEADVVIFCGSLNTMPWLQACVCLERAWASMRTGRLVFNFLSSRAGGTSTGPGLGPALRFDPIEVLEWSLGRTPRVAFRQDYLPQNDATITLSRA